jgi:predicted SnoaL-like aldol condensation-catalyzing enzyme
LAGAPSEEVAVGARENKVVMRRIFDEVINGRNLELADAYYDASHTLYPETSGVGRGPAGMKEAFAGLHEEFPDVHAEIESIVAESDLVAVRVTFTGTHAASAERAAWPEMVFTRFSDEGKALESWEVTDTGRSWDSSPW